jgi:hypothetical protein
MKFHYSAEETPESSFELTAPTDFSTTFEGLETTPAVMPGTKAKTKFQLEKEVHQQGHNDEWERRLKQNPEAWREYPDSPPTVNIGRRKIRLQMPDIVRRQAGRASRIRAIYPSESEYQDRTSGNQIGPGRFRTETPLSEEELRQYYPTAGKEEQYDQPLSWLANFNASSTEESEAEKLDLYQRAKNDAWILKWCTHAEPTEALKAHPQFEQNWAASRELRKRWDDPNYDPYKDTSGAMPIRLPLHGTGETILRRELDSGAHPLLSAQDHHYSSLCNGLGHVVTWDDRTVVPYHPNASTYGVPNIGVVVGAARVLGKDRTPIFTVPDEVMKEHFKTCGKDAKPYGTSCITNEKCPLHIHSTECDADPSTDGGATHSPRCDLAPKLIQHDRGDGIRLSLVTFSPTITNMQARGVRRKSTQSSTQQNIEYKLNPWTLEKPVVLDAGAVEHFNASHHNPSFNRMASSTRAMSSMDNVTFRDDQGNTTRLNGMKLPWLGDESLDIGPLPVPVVKPSMGRSSNILGTDNVLSLMKHFPVMRNLMTKLRSMHQRGESTVVPKDRIVSPAIEWDPTRWTQRSKEREKEKALADVPEVDMSNLVI